MTPERTDGHGLSIKQIEIGPMQNYVYIVADMEQRKALLVDPAWQIQGLVDELDKQDLELVGALITHYHPDHIGGDFAGHHIEGIQELMAARPCKIYIHKAEAPYVQHQLGLTPADYVQTDDSTTVDVGRIPVRLLHTPGHTPGSQCFLVGGHLVSGDTLFIGSCGRVDLPGSNPSDLYYSLNQKLKRLPDETILLPGHNYSPERTSTIAHEKQNNPFMRFESVEDYLHAMGH
ncbi:MAG TPA: MBL fold metallo-hydrolase [Candidatus Binatia bacterium]|jgi:glyoxylase-like metal-dependent hydrolase (beta-lactamase superfamily II)